MRNLLVLIILFTSVICFSQDIKPKGALLNIRGNVGIVRPITSAAFSTCFAGVYEANLSVSVRAFDHFYVGLGYESIYFQSSKFLQQQVTYTASVPYNTNCIGNGGFIRLCYERYFSPKMYMSYALNAGYLDCYYNHVDKSDTTHYNVPFGSLNFSAPYLQPEASINFIAEPRLSFSVLLSYSVLLTHFDPKAPRLNAFDQIRNAGNKFPISWINFGFGFNVLIGK